MIVRRVRSGSIKEYGVENVMWRDWYLIVFWSGWHLSVGNFHSELEFSVKCLDLWKNAKNPHEAFCSLYRPCFPQFRIPWSPPDEIHITHDWRHKKSLWLRYPRIYVILPYTNNSHLSLFIFVMILGIDDEKNNWMLIRSLVSRLDWRVGG